MEHNEGNHQHQLANQLKYITVIRKYLAYLRVSLIRLLCKQILKLLTRFKICFRKSCASGACKFHEFISEVLCLLSTITSRLKNVQLSLIFSLRNITNIDLPIVIITKLRAN